MVVVGVEGSVGVVRVGDRLLGGLTLCIRSPNLHVHSACLDGEWGGVWGGRGEEEVTTPTWGGSLSLCHLLSHYVRLPDEADGRSDLTNATVTTALTHRSE